MTAGELIAIEARRLRVDDRELSRRCETLLERPTPEEWRSRLAACLEFEKESKDAP